MHNGKKTCRSPKEKVQLVLEGLKYPEGILIQSTKLKIFQSSTF